MTNSNSKRLPIRSLRGVRLFSENPGGRIYLVQQRLIIEENPFSESELAEQQALLLQRIRIALREIIAQERAEAAHHARMLARESPANRTLIHTGAFFNGLWNAGVDLTKWAKEVNDVINPTQRLLRSVHASHRAPAAQPGKRREPPHRLCR